MLKTILMIIYIWFLIKLKIRLLQIVEERWANMETIEYLGQAFNLLNQKQKIGLLITDAMLWIVIHQKNLKEFSEKQKVLKKKPELLI